MTYSIVIYSPNGTRTPLQLNPGTQLQIQNTFPSFDDKLEDGIYSLPVEVPWTDPNKLALGFAENLNSHSDSIPDYWRADIESEGIVLIYDAKFKMISHKGRFDGKQGSYSFIATGIQGLFGTLIKNKSLRDLQLGGIIKWNPLYDSRQFAFLVMAQQMPDVAAKLKFAPVAIEDFIDTTRGDFNTEYLHSDTVNNVLIDNVAYPLGWTFGREKPGAINIALPPGTPQYENYRTVPFLNLFFVIKQLFLEFGFTAAGEFFNYPDFNKIHLFNTVSIEMYDYPFSFDVNRQIIPSRHLPDMQIADFLIAIQNAFNLRIDWLDGRKVQFNFKRNLLTSKRVNDFTSKCLQEYSAAQRHEAYEGGMKLQWTWDGSDSYYTDRVKDTKDINVIASVSIVSDISSLVLPAVVDNTTYIYVKSENYYYNFNSTSNQWEAAIEQHEDWKLGKEQIDYTPAISPLCHYYKMDGLGIINRMNMVASCQYGCYYNDQKVYVENPFTLRMFYIDALSSATITEMPISFCHNYDVDGNKLVDTSLSWKAEDGMYEKLWHTWIDMLIHSWNVQSRFMLNIMDLRTLKETDILQTYSNQYLIKKVIANHPLTGVSDVELLKL